MKKVQKRKTLILCIGWGRGVVGFEFFNPYKGLIW